MFKCRKAMVSLKHFPYLTLQKQLLGTVSNFCNLSDYGVYHIKGLIISSSKATKQVKVPWKATREGLQLIMMGTIIYWTPATSQAVYIQVEDIPISWVRIMRLKKLINLSNGMCLDRHRPRPIDQTQMLTFRFKNWPFSPFINPNGSQFCYFFSPIHGKC